MLEVILDFIAITEKTSKNDQQMVIRVISKINYNKADIKIFRTNAQHFDRFSSIIAGFDSQRCYQHCTSYL